MLLRVKPARRRSARYDSTAAITTASRATVARPGGAWRCRLSRSTRTCRDCDGAAPDRWDRGPRRGAASRSRRCGAAHGRQAARCESPPAGTPARRPRTLHRWSGRGRSARSSSGRRDRSPARVVGSRGTGARRRRPPAGGAAGPGSVFCSVNGSCPAPSRGRSGVAAPHPGSETEPRQEQDHRVISNPCRLVAVTYREHARELVGGQMVW